MRKCKNIGTYLYFTVVTVSEATLLPISFAPTSKLDQTAENPDTDFNGRHSKDFGMLCRYSNILQQLNKIHNDK